MRATRTADGIALIAEPVAPPRPQGVTHTVLTTVPPGGHQRCRQRPARQSRWPATAGYRATLAVPLRLGETVSGVLYTSAFAPHAFPDHEVNLLQIFANQAAIAIANARLFEERGQRLNELATLQAQGLALTATLDLPAVLTEIVQATLHLLPLDSSVVLVEEPGRAGWYRAIRGHRAGDTVLVDAAEPPQPRSGGQTDQIRTSATAMLVPDALHDPRVSPAALAAGRAGVGGRAAAPGRAGGRRPLWQLVHARAPSPTTRSTCCKFSPTRPPSPSTTPACSRSADAAWPRSPTCNNWAWP